MNKMKFLREAIGLRNKVLSNRSRSCSSNKILVSDAVDEKSQWLKNNPDALALVKTGIAQAKEGKVKRMSFVEYADIEIDDE